uniref:Uncharacterized protein n=1 Tax=Triticum urartu TaxID=4572 RepID=A0A8R7TYS7_TRIUA
MSTARRGGDLPDQMVRNLLEQESLHRRQDHLQLLHLHPRSRRQLVRACPSILPVPHPRQGLLQPQRHAPQHWSSQQCVCCAPSSMTR